MSDYFFTDFYNQVRDNSWPTVTTYGEFLKLPSNIQQECFQMHNLQQRLNELEDQKYWMNHSYHAIGYQYQDVVYVPVMKCANSYYVDLLHTQNGWTPVKLSELDLDQVHLFGLLLHPLTRRIKGILQNLGASYHYDYKKILSLLQNLDFAWFVSRISTLDAHTMPYSFLFGPLINKINWIPIERFTDTELQQQVKNFANKHAVDIKVPDTILRINQSSTIKNQCFTELQKIYFQTEPMAELYCMFSQDLTLYHRLIESYETSHYNN